MKNTNPQTTPFFIGLQRIFMIAGLPIMIPLYFFFAVLRGAEFMCNYFWEDFARVWKN